MAQLFGCANGTACAANCPVGSCTANTNRWLILSKARMDILPSERTIKFGLMRPEPMACGEPGSIAELNPWYQGSLPLRYAVWKLPAASNCESRSLTANGAVAGFTPLFPAPSACEACPGKTPKRLPEVEAAVLSNCQYQ